MHFQSGVISSFDQVTLQTKGSSFRISTCLPWDSNDLIWEISSDSLPAVAPNMWKKNLWTPLSPILRRRFPSFSPNCTLNIPSSTIFSSPCSSTAQYSRVFWSSSYDFLGSLKFSRKLCSAQSAEQVHVRCWNCKAAAQTTPFLACDSCRSVQPVDPSVDYFQIFGL